MTTEIGETAEQSARSWQKRPGTWAAVALLVGTSTALGIATAGTAAADTPQFSVTCTKIPVVGTAAFPTTISGTISPDPETVSGAALLNSFGMQLKVPGSLVQIATSSGNATVSGSIQFTVTATGATPASQSVTLTLPRTTLTSSEDSSGATITVSASPLIFTVPAPGPVTVKSGTAYSVTLDLNGSTLPAFGCTAPVETIASPTSTHVTTTTTTQPRTTTTTTQASGSTTSTTSGGGATTTTSGGGGFTTTTGGGATQTTVADNGQGTLAFTGPGPDLYILGLVGLLLIDVAYLVLTVVDRPRNLLRAAVHKVSRSSRR